MIDDDAQGRLRNYDHIFTPEVMAELEAARQQSREGKCFTIEQVHAHFEAMKKEEPEIAWGNRPAKRR